MRCPKCGAESWRTEQHSDLSGDHPNPKGRTLKSCGLDFPHTHASCGKCSHDEISDPSNQPKFRELLNEALGPKPKKPGRERKLISEKAKALVASLIKLSPDRAALFESEEFGQAVTEISDRENLARLCNALLPSIAQISVSKVVYRPQVAQILSAARLLRRARANLESLRPGTSVLVASGTSADINLKTNTFNITPKREGRRSYSSVAKQWITEMPVVFTLEEGGTVTGLTSGDTYFVIRSSPETVKLASSAKNARKNIPIDLTGKSNPHWTITHRLRARRIAEAKEFREVFQTSGVPIDIPPTKDWPFPIQGGQHVPKGVLIPEAVSFLALELDRIGQRFILRDNVPGLDGSSVGLKKGVSVDAASRAAIAREVVKALPVRLKKDYALIAALMNLAGIGTTREAVKSAATS